MRIGLISANAIVLGAVVLFILNAPSLHQTLRADSLSGVDAQSVAGPLDQLSSADIAVNVARIARLPEAQSVGDHADSVNARVTSSKPTEQV